MLFQKLLGARIAPAATGLTFVGGVGLSSTATQTPSYSLTGLTGGLASAPAIGDIVIACVGFDNSTNRNITCTTTGYTEILDGIGGTATQMGVYYKVLTAADTSVAFDLGTSVASRFTCHVWRNINSTPIDATLTTSTALGIPDPSAITTVTNNAVVIAVAFSSGGLPSTTPTAPTGMSNLFSSGAGASTTMAIASVLVTTAGSYDPGTFGGFNSSNRYLSATLALRPA